MTTVELGSESHHLRLTPNADDGTVPHSLLAELRADSLLAVHSVEQHYVSGFADLVTFFDSLVDDWRGWTGERRWESLEGELQVTATHDGHVRLAVTVRAAYPGDWRAWATISLDPGEQLSQAAHELGAMAAGFTP